VTTDNTSAYRDNKAAIDKANRTIWRRTALTLALALAVSIGTQIYDTITIGQVRATQVSNTRVSVHQDHCQELSFNAILKDARLAFEGDHNAADYAQPPKEC
jgi:hypothetical protein